MSAIHIHSPQATDRHMRREDCPWCKRRTFFLGFYTPWYGFTWTCLKCGDSHDGEEWSPRPFERAWRKRAVDSVKKRWRAWNQAAADAAHEAVGP